MGRRGEGMRKGIFHLTIGVIGLIGGVWGISQATQDYPIMGIALILLFLTIIYFTAKQAYKDEAKKSSPPGKEKRE